MRLFLLFLFCFKAHAYQSSLNSGSRGLVWPDNQIPVVISPANGDLSSSTANTIIRESIAEWNAHTSTQIVPTSSALSSISFEDDFSIYGPGVIGVTELSFTSGGVIQQAKVLLNDDNYDFQSSPGLYSSGDVYLGDVVTHELGHLMGLSHSEVLEASMFYAAFPGQSTLSSDDRAGVKSKYDSNFGTISGYVRGGDDIGILGVHVVAFSRTSGEAVGVISDQSGYFSIKGLDLNDSYYLYTGPLKNLSSLPGQFANAQTDFCPASYVGGFFDACGRENEGFPQAVTLTNTRPSVNVGDVTIHCSLKTNEDYSAEKVSGTFDPVTIFDYSVDQRFEKAFVGNFLTQSGTGWSEYDKLVVDLSTYGDTAAALRYLRLNFIARQFGNLLEYEMVVRQNGVEVGTYQIVPTAVQTFTTDMVAFLSLDSNPANNVFEIDIRSRKMGTALASQTFAELEAFVTNQYLPYLLTTSIESSSGPVLDTTSILSDNSACLDAPFAYSVATARTLAGATDSSTSTDGPVSPGCGTTGSPPSEGGGPGSATLILGFLLALTLSSLGKRTKNILS